MPFVALAVYGVLHLGPALYIWSDISACSLRLHLLFESSHANFLGCVKVNDTGSLTGSRYLLGRPTKFQKAYMPQSDTYNQKCARVIESDRFCSTPDFHPVLKRPSTATLGSCLHRFPTVCMVGKWTQRKPFAGTIAWHMTQNKLAP